MKPMTPFDTVREWASKGEWRHFPATITLQRTGHTWECLVHLFNERACSVYFVTEDSILPCVGDALCITHDGADVCANVSEVECATYQNGASNAMIIAKVTYGATGGHND